MFDGHTRRICERLRNVLASAGHGIALMELDDRTDVDPGRYDKVVVGGAQAWQFAREIGAL